MYFYVRASGQHSASVHSYSPFTPAGSKHGTKVDAESSSQHALRIKHAVIASVGKGIP